MKKASLLLLTVITIANFYACNGGGDKSSEAAKPDSTKTESSKNKISFDINCAGVWNMTLEESEAQEMRKRFDSIYKKRNLVNSVWIDKLVINSLAAFFETAEGNKYDGVRFVNGVASLNAESSVMLVPTKQVPNSNPDSVGHKEIFGNVFSLLEGDPLKFTNFNMTESRATTLQNNFQDIFRTVKNPSGHPIGIIDSLSTKVWMNKCIFIALKEIIEYDNNQVDGIMVCYGAYKDFGHRIRGQFKGNQSTIILVPTSSDGANGHTERWDIIKSVKSNSNYIHDAGYNHGELCPQQCN